MSKKLYTGFSLFQFFYFTVIRMLIGYGIFITVPHYKENPLVVSIALIGMGILLFILGEDQILVYSDKIVQRTNSIFNLFFSFNGKTYPISQIKEVYIEDKRITKPDFLSDIVAMALMFMLPSKTATRTNRDGSSFIYLDMNNGTTQTISTYLSQSQKEKVAQVSNECIKKINSY